MKLLGEKAELIISVLISAHSCGYSNVCDQVEDDDNSEFDIQYGTSLLRPPGFQDTVFEQLDGSGLLLHCC